MYGQVLSEGALSGEEVPEEDWSKTDLAGWHGMSSAIPAIGVACAECSTPFIAEA